MATYTRIFGHTTRNKFQAQSTVSLGSYNEAAILVVFRAPTGVIGATAKELFSTHNSSTDGARIAIQSESVRAIWRTTATSTLVNIGAVTTNQLCVVAIHCSKTAGLQRFVFNGSIHGTTVDMSGAITLRVAANMQPWIQGIDSNGNEIEVADFAIWHTNIPAIAELQAHVAGDDLSGFSVAPVWHGRSVGSDGAFATQFTAQIGTNHATHIAGDLDDTSENQPIYVVYDDPVPDLEATAVSTARTLTISGTVAAAGGTLYCVVDTAANLPAAPGISDIVGGFLDNGTTPAFDSFDIDMTGETEFLIPVPLVSADLTYGYSLVHDTDDAGEYSEVAYGTISTKRPVVVPAGDDKKWYKASGALRTSESGIVLSIPGTAYTQSGLTTNGAAEGIVNLTTLVNSGLDVDIGDEVDFDLDFSDGETLAARGLTVTEGA